jgi:hypothetical protein
MKHSTELPPIAPVTPLESDGLDNHWYGLARYPGQTHPRFTPVLPATVLSIPSKAESTEAQTIVTEFGKMLAQYDEHNPTPLERAAQREQNVVKRHALLRQIDAMVPEKHGEAVEAMRRLRREAATLGATLCDRLAAKLREELLALTLKIESERKELGWPIVERNASEIRYYLHADSLWDQSQIRYLQAKAIAERLRTRRLVDDGIAGELDVLRHFLGIQGGGLALC